MSNLNPFFQDLSFNPEEVTAVNQAYDLACQTLQNIGQLEVDREIIARGTLQAAESGERDANKLCERAIHGLTALDYRQHGSKTNTEPTGSSAKTETQRRTQLEKAPANQRGFWFIGNLLIEQPVG
jgi:hypothetical protein